MLPRGIFSGVKDKSPSYGMTWEQHIKKLSSSLFGGQIVQSSRFEKVDLHEKTLYVRLETNLSNILNTVGAAYYDHG